MTSSAMLTHYQCQTLCTSPNYAAVVPACPVVPNAKSTAIQFRVQYIGSANCLAIDAVAVIKNLDSSVMFKTFEKESQIKINGTSVDTIASSTGRSKIDIFQDIILSESKRKCTLDFTQNPPEILLKDLG